MWFKNLLIYRLTHDLPFDAFFLAGGNQQEVLADVNQRGVFAFAERGNETVGGYFLA